jgi:hypothetical protein
MVAIETRIRKLELQASSGGWCCCRAQVVAVSMYYAGNPVPVRQDSGNCPRCGLRARPVIIRVEYDPPLPWGAR